MVRNDSKTAGLIHAPDKSYSMSIISFNFFSSPVIYRGQDTEVQPGQRCVKHLVIV